MAWPQQAGVPGVGFNPAVPPIQVQPQQQPGFSYSIDHLPPPPGQQQLFGYQPQQGGQPTAVPGMQQVQPYYAQPQQPQQAPLPPQWQQPPQQPVQPGYVPQMQLPPQMLQPQGYQQPQAPAQGITDATIIDGPGVPQELRGRQWGEVKRLYTALSSDWLQRNRPQTPAQQTLQQQQPPAMPYQQAPGAAPQAAWAQPIAQAVAQALQPVLQPLQAQGQEAAILRARSIAMQGNPDFTYLEPDIMAMVANAAPEALQNPATWSLAAEAVRGRRVLAGQYNPRQAQQQAQQQFVQAPGRQQQMGPGVAVPAYQAPQTYQFFTENPTAPQVPGLQQGPRQPTPEDQFYAQKWNMPMDVWMQWKHGVQPQALPGGTW